jgi:putative chitinase
VESTAATLTPPTERQREQAVEQSDKVTEPPTSDPTTPGNVALKERVGSRLTDADPTAIGPEAVTPTDLPPPPDTKVQTPLTSLEGADIMTRALNAAGIKDSTQRAMIWGQVAHESANFTTLVENDRYSRKGLLTAWKGYFVDDPSSKYHVDNYLGNPEAILNRVYAGKIGNAKDEAVGDGYKYRGRGFIQLTGKGNYLAASRALGIDFVTYPDAATQADTAAKLAIWYFQTYRGGYKGSYGDNLLVTKYVNGGTNGLDDRERRYLIGLQKPVVTIYSNTFV